MTNNPALKNNHFFKPLPDDMRREWEDYNARRASLGWLPVPFDKYKETRERFACN